MLVLYNAIEDSVYKSTFNQINAFTLIVNQSHVPLS